MDRDEKVARIKYRAQQSRLRTPEHTRAHRGRYPCPKCGCVETGADSAATSAYWTVFMCDFCGHKWRKKSESLSEASKGLRKALGVLKRSGL